MEKIDKSIDELGLDKKDKRIINNWEIYKENGINLGDYQVMMFDRQVKKK